jgi:hypothetical protein
MDPFSCCCTFFVIIAIIISNLNKAKVNTLDDNSGNTPDIEDIFKNVKVNQGSGNRSLPNYSNRPASRTNKNSNSKPATTSRNSLVAPSTHKNHICEDVNYDDLGSLEGGSGSFNLSSEPTTAVFNQQNTKVSFGKEDLLKSFIMSEVLQ